jgi:hypothetical protein
MSKLNPNWPDGPWNDEPDSAEWLEQGFPCMAIRNPSLGNWCGYLAVHKGHPWYGKGDDEINADIHGGLTYSSCALPRGKHHADEMYDCQWFGFDCAHAWDVIPELDVTRSLEGQEYRTLEFVKDQLRGLADQAVAAQK